MHRQFPSLPTKDQDLIIRRRELDLAIDNRLRVEFPDSRREQLWEIKQRVKRKRLLLAMKYLIRRIVSKTRAFAEADRESGRLTGFMIDEFRHVLSEPELESFFEMTADELPTADGDSDGGE